MAQHPPFQDIAGYPLATGKPAKPLLFECNAPSCLGAGDDEGFARGFADLPGAMRSLVSSDREHLRA